MGLKIHYVGRKQQFRSFEENVNDITSHYKISDGYFGIKGSKTDIREIHTRNHEATAKDFFNRVAKGGLLDLDTIPGGVVAHMKDGTFISYRKVTSSVNSPAVEIRYRRVDSKYGIRDQKIHFVAD